MRKILFILSFLLLLNKGYSQNNFNPFKLDNVEWFELEAVMNHYYNGSDYNYNFYKICGDSIYNDTLYKKIYFGKVFSPNYQLAPWLVPTAPPSFSFYCFFRQDTLTKSNYYRMPNSVDSLLCSYNLNLGDTLKRGKYANDYYNIHFTQSGVPTIKKIDSISIDGKKFKRYYTDTCGISGYNSNCSGTQLSYLIEGLGHSSGIFYWYTNIWAEYSRNRVDSMAFSIDCNAMGSGIKTIHYYNTVNIYPNPSSGIFIIETNTSTKQAMQVYDVNGRVVLSQFINGKTSLDMSNLPAGVYNVTITSNESVANKRVVIVR